MKKKIITIIFILLALLALSAFIAYRIQVVKNTPKQAETNDGGLIFFYGDGCPHCLNVEKFMADNKVEEKIKIDKKEVYKDQNNAALLGVEAKKCGLNTNSIGVPLLWDGVAEKCFIGDTDVINYLQEKIK